MPSAGASPELTARTLHAMRRTIGVKHKNLTPPDMRERTYQRNLAEYKNPLGLTVDFLRRQGKSWEQIIESSSGPEGEIWSSDTMYVESHDRFADVGEFNPELGRLEVYPRSDVTGRPTLGGHFSHLSGELCVLYRLEGALWLQVGEKQWRLEEQGVSADWTSLGEDLSELVVRDKGREIVRVRYQPTGRLYEDDVTPFVELEHFDFGLFVRNVLSDSGRRRRIYSEGL